MLPATVSPLLHATKAGRRFTEQIEVKQMAYEKGDGKTVVIALGGNALGNTPQEQLELVQNTAKHIVDMIEEGTNVVVAHGNGPQVGMINNAFAYAAANDDKTPDMPFPEAGAMSQGYIGYQLSQAILNDVKSRGIPRSTACIVTQTVVDEKTPQFISGVISLDEYDAYVETIQSMDIERAAEILQQAYDAFMAR